MMRRQHGFVTACTLATQSEKLRPIIKLPDRITASNMNANCATLTEMDYKNFAVKSMNRDAFYCSLACAIPTHASWRRRSTATDGWAGRRHGDLESGAESDRISAGCALTLTANDNQVCPWDARVKKPIVHGSRPRAAVDYGRTELYRRSDDAAADGRGHSRGLVLGMEGCTPSASEPAVTALPASVSVSTKIYVLMERKGEREGWGPA